jgi:hypothetical protein
LAVIFIVNPEKRLPFLPLTIQLAACIIFIPPLSLAFRLVKTPSFYTHIYTISINAASKGEGIPA